MQKNLSISSYAVISRLNFSLSLLLFIYWYVAMNVNVYKFIVLGALYELLWLPMLPLLVILPAISVFLLTRQGFSLKALPFYSLLISLAAWLVIILS
jgi:hypothetical protein